MKIKVDGKIYKVVKVVFDPFDKGNYYFVEGQKTPFGDLDYEIEIVDFGLQYEEAIKLIKQKRVKVDLLIAYRKRRDFYNADLSSQRQLSEKEWNLLIEVFEL